MRFAAERILLDTHGLETYSLRSTNLKFWTASPIRLVRSGAAILRKLDDKATDGAEQERVDHPAFVKQKLLSEPDSQQNAPYQPEERGIYF